MCMLLLHVLNITSWDNHLNWFNNNCQGTIVWCLCWRATQTIYFVPALSTGTYSRAIKRCQKAPTLKARQVVPCVLRNGNIYWARSIDWSIANMHLSSDGHARSNTDFLILYPTRQHKVVISFEPWEYPQYTVQCEFSAYTYSIPIELRIYLWWRPHWLLLTSWHSVYTLFSCSAWEVGTVIIDGGKPCN